MYWDSILNEILNQYASDYPFYYTAIRDKHQEPQEEPRGAREKPVKHTLDSERGWYLTNREMQCIKGFLAGHTIKSVATSLKLSPRTVEFYLKRIKERFKCRTKRELLARLSEFDLLKQRN